MRHASLASLLVLCAASLQGQDWHVLASMGSLEHAMVYDPVRDRIVMFAHGPTQPQLLEWDGNRWYSTSLSSGPWMNTVPRFAYDEARHEAVLMLFQTTWRYDGSRWDLAATSGPGSPFSYLSRSVTAYDPSRQVVVYYDALFMATAEWDGLQWRTVSAGMHWATHSQAFLGYDPVRQQTLGFLPAGFLPSSTVAWNGSTWTPVPEAPRPAGFPTDMVLTCPDPVRNRLLAYGGAGLWEWTGSAWTFVAAGPSLQNPTMARHVGSGQLVLFGLDPVDESRQTWVYDTSFHRRDAVPTLTRIATDPARQRIVGVGPQLRTTASQQYTWEWDGAAWTRVAGPHPPFSGLVYDGTRAVFVGIQNDFSLTHLRTLFWQGGSWQLQNPPVSPGWQPGHALCHDPVRGVLFLFGLHGTWEFDGSTWVHRTPAHAPNAFGSAAYDVGAGVVRMLASTTSGNEEWQWDGTDWAQLATPGVPQVAGPELAYDPVRGRVLCLAAASSGGGATWERTGNGWQYVTGPPPSAITATDPFTGGLRCWRDGAWSGLTADVAALATYGSGCGTNVPWLAGVGRPAPGEGTVKIDLGAAPAVAPLALYASLAAGNLALGGGCTLLLGPAVHAGGAVANAGGFGSFTVAMPSGATLLGLDVFWQGATLEPGGPLLGVAALTNGLRLHIGD